MTLVNAINGFLSGAQCAFVMQFRLRRAVGAL